MRPVSRAVTHAEDRQMSPPDRILRHGEPPSGAARQPAA
jgi:hypothetical protein